MPRASKGARMARAVELRKRALEAPAPDAVDVPLGVRAAAMRKVAGVGRLVRLLRFRQVGKESLPILRVCRLEKLGAPRSRIVETDPTGRVHRRWVETRNLLHECEIPYRFRLPRVIVQHAFTVELEDFRKEPDGERVIVRKFPTGG